jgi:Superinfection immunity protein
MLPIILAFCPHMSNRCSITLLKVFIGWTLIGWVGALAWAVSGTAKREVGS